MENVTWSRYVASPDTLLYLEGERHYFRTLTAIEWEQRKRSE